MALIVCKECSNEVSSDAKTCPKCGVRVKPASKVWMWILGVPLGVFLIFAVIGANDPQAAEKRQARDVYALCKSDMADPMRSASFRDAARSMCEKLRDDFRAKYHVEP